MDDILAIVLGGGRGSRLYPLTKLRAKPALPLAGKYRLIDIPVSNCINSGIQKIYVITQFNSASLNQHISSTYRFSGFSKGFVQVLAAQQTPDSPDWFMGTADAVRKSLWVMDSVKADDYLILSGDHLYRMDYRPFVEQHRNSSADVTISVVPMNAERASSFGLLKIDESGRIVEFKEKPTPDGLDQLKVDTGILGLDRATAEKNPYIASMGIYLFKRKVLDELLNNNTSLIDFGKDAIPFSIHHYSVRAYLFKGYWEDIGTIETFYRANLELVKQPNPSFSFYDEEFPIYAHARFLPPSKILNADLRDAMICDGCIVKSSRVVNSIIGIRSRLENNSVIENTLMMGADFYQSMDERDADIKAGRVPVGVGTDSIIRNAIIDKNARIGRRVSIVNKNNIQNKECEREGYSVCSGIVVVLKGATIPDNAVI